MAIVIFFASLQLLFALLLQGIIIFKTACFGILSLIVHWTNWSLQWQVIFFVGALPEIISYRPLRSVHIRCAGHFVAACYFPLLASIVYVALGVYTILLMDAAFLEKLFETMGVGEVIFGNSVLHFIPVLAYAIFTIVKMRFIMYSLRLWLVGALRPHRLRCCRISCLLAYWLFAGSLSVFIAYLCVLAAEQTNLQEIYEVTVSTEFVVASYIINNVLVVGIPLCICVNSYGIARRHKSLDDEELYVQFTDFELEQVFR